MTVMMTVIYCDMRIIYLAEFTAFAEDSAGHFDDQDDFYNHADAFLVIVGTKMCSSSYLLNWCSVYIWWYLY